MMNLHDFLHISAMIHCEVRRVLQKLPLAMEAERKLMMEIKDLIEAYDKEARIRRALLAFSKVRVIANLDDATWKTIAEDEGIADQYAE